MKQKSNYNLLALFIFLIICFDTTVFASYIKTQKIQSVLPLETPQQIRDECTTKYILSLDKECYSKDRIKKVEAYLNCSQKSIEELYDIMDMQLSSIVGINNFASYKQKCDKFKGYVITKWLPGKQIIENNAIKKSSECILANDKLTATKKCYNKVIANYGEFNLKSIMREECGKYPDIINQIAYAINDRPLLESIFVKIIYENRKKCRSQNYNKKIEETEHYKRLISLPETAFIYDTNNNSSSKKIVPKFEDKEINNLAQNKKSDTILNSNANNKKKLEGKKNNSKYKEEKKDEALNKEKDNKNEDSKSKEENKQNENNENVSPQNSSNEKFSDNEFDIDLEDTSYTQEKLEDLTSNYGKEIYLIYDTESNCKDIAIRSKNKIEINDHLDLCRAFFTHEFTPIFQYANKYNDRKLCLAYVSQKDNALITYNKYVDIKKLYPFISFNSFNNIIENDGINLLENVKATCKRFYDDLNIIKLDITKNNHDRSNNTALEDFLTKGNKSGYCEDIDLGINNNYSKRYLIDDTYDEQIIYYGMIKSLFSDNSNIIKANECLKKLNDTCNKLKNLNSFRCKQAYKYLETTINTFVQRDNLFTDDTPRFIFYKTDKIFKDYVDIIVANYTAFSHNFRQMLKTLTPNIKLIKFY